MDPAAPSVDGPRRPRPLRRWILRALLAAAGLAGLPVLGLFGLNFFLNGGLLWLVNRQPERLQMAWSWAWTWNLRDVEVRGFELRVQGPADQWWLRVDEARLAIHVPSLLHRRFDADRVRARGAALHYRARMDAPPIPGEPPLDPYVPGRTAPIPGLANPPEPPPEEIYPPAEAPWLIALGDIVALDVHELWLGDYQYVGDATLTGELVVHPGYSVDVWNGTVEGHDGEIVVEGMSVVSDLVGEGTFELVGLDPVSTSGAAVLRHFSTRLEIGARAYDFGFLDPFLRDAPWLQLSGGYGELRTALAVSSGVVGPGTWAEANGRDLEARFGGYATLGDGRMALHVADDGKGRLSVRLDEFAIHRTGEPVALVRGAGFRVDASAPALRLYEPPEGITAVATLPDSEVPDLSVFGAYLPDDAGLLLDGGRARVHGQARIAADGQTVSGELVVDIPSFRARYGSSVIVGSGRLEGRVPTGSLDRGEYGIRGSRLYLHDVRVGDTPAGWWATMEVEQGRVATEAREYLRAETTFRCRDSAPLLRLAVGDLEIAPWVARMLTLRQLAGEARLALAEDTFELAHLAVSSPKAELHVHMKETVVGAETTTDALVFVRLGALGAAAEVVGEDTTVMPLDARRWFHARLAARGTPEVMRSLSGEIHEEVKDTRKGLKLPWFKKKPAP